MVNPPSLESIKEAIRDKGSDGDEGLLPPAGEIVPSSGGAVDALVEADAETIKHWLSKIGNYLIHEGRGKWNELEENRTYMLKRFPSGYKLYTRIKGPKEDPRKDSYLYGSSTERCKEFRSPEEFALHAKWLAFGKPKDENGSALCECCHCSKRPQGEISPMLRDKIQHLNMNASPTSRSGGSRHERELSYASTKPIMYKDYTQLDQGEGVTRWVDGGPAGLNMDN